MAGLRPAFVRAAARLHRCSRAPASLLTLTLTLVLFAAACGAPPPPTATPRPTLTPTPLSTPLPPAPTAAAYGSSANPYHLVIVNADKSASGAKLAAFLSDQMGSAVEVDVVATQAEALAFVCGAKPSAAIGDGRLVLAALAQNCGALAFRLLGPDGKTGTRVDLIVRESTDKNDRTLVKSIADLRSRDACRLSSGDLASWVLPELALRAGGLTPATDVRGFKEFATVDQMLQAVANGTCAFAGIASGTLSSYAVALAPGVTLRPLVTTPEYPYGGLVMSALVPGPVATRWKALIGDNAAQLSGLLGAGKLAPAADANADLTEFIRFAESAGLDMRLIGQ